MKLARNFLLNSWHKDWYICQSEKRKDYGTQIILDYYNGEPDVLDRCTFVLSPHWKDKYEHCRHALGPVQAPEINGQPLPHPPHLVETTPAPPFVLPSCIPVCPAKSKEATTQGAAAIPSSSGVPIISSPSKSKFRSIVSKQRHVVPSAYGAGVLGGLQPPLSEKNSIIWAKLMYRSGKDRVKIFYYLIS